MASHGTVPQPKAILRGHKAQVHAASFIRNNSRLVTGDADGFVVSWDLTIMRPRTVWQAHTNTILGVAGWDSDKVITHGRDHKLIVWQLAAADEANLSALSPLDPSSASRPQPWMLHLLEVNTMNFCAFSACTPPNANASLQSELLVAVPNTLKSEAIDIFHLPSQHRIHTVNFGDKNGMAMAVSLLNQGPDLIVIAGFESGLAIVARVDELGNVTVRYQAQPHSQPILSLDVAPGKEYFLTSSADAIIAKHPIPLANEVHHNSSKSDPTMAQTEQPPPTKNNSKEKGNPKPSVSLLSAALASEKQAAVSDIAKPSKQHLGVETTPLKIINTKHSGQQSLRVRSDSRVFATAGWDSRVRVYSAKTMKEVAVLKWHQVGCFAVSFSDIESDGTGTPTTANTAESSADRSLVPRLTDLSVKEKRIKHAETAHWLAAGSKDGKVSLWDVF